MSFPGSVLLFWDDLRMPLPVYPNDGRSFPVIGTIQKNNSGHRILAGQPPFRQDQIEQPTGSAAAVSAIGQPVVPAHLHNRRMTSGSADNSY